MRPRTLGLIVTLALIILGAPLAGNAQQPTKVARIGWLGASSPSDNPHLREAFWKGMRELGYMEGKNIVAEYRYAHGRLERLPDLAAELVRQKPDIIVALTAAVARAARQATTTIPIVFISTGDPVGSGLVASLARPGGNITGTSFDAGPEINGRQLQLLVETVPNVSRVGVLWNPTNPFLLSYWRETQVAARALGLTLQSVEVQDPNEFESAFAAMTREGAGALIVLSDIFATLHRRRIADLAAKHRLAAVYGHRLYVEAGGLMAYGPLLPYMFQRAATFVDKILKGAKPADLPVEQPTKFEFVINLKTAKALGLTIPQSILLRADEIIQ